MRRREFIAGLAAAAAIAPVAPLLANAARGVSFTAEPFVAAGGIIHISDWHWGDIVGFETIGYGHHYFEPRLAKLANGAGFNGAGLIARMEGDRIA